MSASVPDLRGHPVAEVFAAALRGSPAHLHDFHAKVVRIPVHGWTGPVTAGDRAVLDLCVGPTLDIGCGPGRMGAHLAALGRVVLGIDVVPEAVLQARDRGMGALLRDVFEPVPGEGRWETALLADGNIGIGGDPVALLTRVAELVAREGRLVVDVAAPGTGLRTRQARIAAAGLKSRPFAWSLVGADALPGLAEAAGLRVVETHEHAGRWFAVVRR